MKVKIDIVLILAVIALMTLALLPGQKSPPAASDPSQGTDQNHEISEGSTRADKAGLSDKIDRTLEAVERHRSDLDQATSLAKSSGRHRDGEAADPKLATEAPPVDGSVLLPLEAGTTWQYQVYGDDKLAIADTWTMRLVNEPTESGPGTVEMWFGQAATTPVRRAALELNGEAVRFTDFPLFAPLELQNARTTSGEGALFPDPIRVIDGAVWNHIQHQELTYTYQDKKGASHAVEAKAVVNNRANVREFAPVIVPADRFDAYRIEWISRVNIKAEGRPILKHLTAEPFRRETMWVAPGIGIVKRDIDFLRDGRTERSVTFSLIRFTPATPEAEAP